MDDAPPLTVTLSESPLASVLEAEWRDLESRADVSFFTSWTWIGAWMRQLPASLKPTLLRATQGPRTVGLALLMPRHARRLGVIGAKTLHLHATGDDGFDDITLEYNGLVADREASGRVTQAFVRHLEGCRAWEELHLAAMRELPAGLAAMPGVRVSGRTRPSYLVDLAKVRARSDGYLALLGQKPRYSVRRSLKACGRLGEVKLEVAEDLPTARRWLESLKHLHAQHWNARGAGGAFATPFANAFHDDLLAAGMPRGEIQMRRLRAGDEAVGYLYNFVHRGHVMTYQAGIHYALLPATDSPGMATHALAIEHNAARGHGVYDFMVGDQQYKRALATDTVDQHWIVLQRERVKFRIERALRELRDRLRAGATRKVAAA